MIAPQVLAADCHALPPLSAATFKVLGLLKKGEASSRALEDALMTDPALAANVLRIANSPFLGLRREVRSLSQAITIIGQTRLGELAVTMSLQTSLPKVLPGYGITQQEFLVHSLAVAVLSERLSRAVTPGAHESPFVAGLLHDVGKIVLARHLQARQSSLELDLSRHLTLIETERDLLGTDHTQVAELLGKIWRLPSDVTAAAVGHHAPEKYVDSPDCALIDVVHIADITAHAIGYGRDVAGLARAISPGCFHRLKVRSADIERLVSECLDSLASVCRAVLAQESSL